MLFAKKYSLVTQKGFLYGAQNLRVANALSQWVNNRFISIHFEAYQPSLPAVTVFRQGPRRNYYISNELQYPIV